MSAFKLWINKELLKEMATAIREVHPTFDTKKFISIAPDLDSLELKPRVHRVRDQLREQLPQDFPRALDILMQSLKSKRLSGFGLWPYTEFIQKFGQSNLEESLGALKVITKLFTGEFAVRPFIKANPKESLKHLLNFSLDSDVHVRRLSSEGSRSRLPWGERLDLFISDPHLTVPILENLKYDEELYVRKSVSNHLNDLAKDNPGVVLKLLKKWKSDAPKIHQKKIEWIVNRACRTLIKDGHPKALQLIGAQVDTQVTVSPLKLNKNKFKLNERIEFEFDIQSKSKKDQKIVIDYIIHYVKSNKTTSPKVFKLKNIRLGAGEKLRVSKKHHLKKVTTRRHYSGNHWIEIQVNGKRFSQFQWKLSV